MRWGLIVLGLLLIGFFGFGMWWWENIRGLRHYQVAIIPNTLSQYFDVKVWSIDLGNVLTDGFGQSKGEGKEMKVTYYTSDGKKGGMTFLIPEVILVYPLGVKEPELWEKDKLVKYWSRSVPITIQLLLKTERELDFESCKQQSIAWLKARNMEKYLDPWCVDLFGSFKLANTAGFPVSINSSNLDLLNGQRVAVRAIRLSNKKSL